MKLIIAFFMVLACYSYVNGQVVKGSANRPDIIQQPTFKNEGEQEDHWASDLFKNRYSPEIYSRYEGSVLVNGANYIFAKQVVTVYDSSFCPLFKRGIIYPALILGANQAAPGFYVNLKIRLPPSDSSKHSRVAEKRAVPFHQPNIDSLFVGNFEELKSLEISPKHKRFRFLMMIKGLPNPILYFMELTNENVTSDADLPTFINGATITFIRQASILI